MLITPEYASQQAQLHASTEYGTAGKMYGPLVSQIVEKLEITHLLDYGCGKQMSLLKTLKSRHRLTYQAYDPGSGLEELMTDPVPAQMVACIDVLEHIEPDCLDQVFDHLKSLTELVLFATVHTGPAMKTLPDGRNAHLTQQGMAWWMPKFFARFDVQTVQQSHEHGFYVIAYSNAGEIQAPDGTKLSDEPTIYITGE